MDRRTKGLFLLVGAVALAAIGVAIWALLFGPLRPQPFLTLPLRWRTMPCPQGKGRIKCPRPRAAERSTSPIPIR